LIQLREYILQLSKDAQSVALMSHINPDGDGFCASLALQRYLKCQGILAPIIVDDLKLKRFDYLTAEAQLLVYTPEQEFGLIIVLDCNSMDRLGQRADLILKAQDVLVIDHHQKENHVIPHRYMYIEPSHVSTGVILHLALYTDIIRLEPQDRLFIAECIYTTILNDTNNFVNANTNAEVYEIGAELCKWGLKTYQTYQKYFQNYASLELRFIGETLSTIELVDDNRVLFMHSDIAMQDHNGMEKTSPIGMTRWVQGTSDIDVIVYLREEETETYKVSLRSPKINVNAIAAKYGGGGHISASGCTIKGKLSAIKTALNLDIQAALTHYDSLYGSVSPNR